MNISNSWTVDEGGFMNLGDGVGASNALGKKNQTKQSWGLLESPEAEVSALIKFLYTLELGI